MLSLSILAVVVSTGFASADTYRKDKDKDDRRPVVRDNRRPAPAPVVRDNRTYNRPAPAPVVRDNRTYNRPAPVVRDNRTYNNNRPARVYTPGRTVVRNNRTYVTRPRYTGNYRQNRVIVDRRPLYSNNGTFRFHNGRTVVYQRPIIRDRYYDVRVRPQVIVENYPSQYGYVWVSGSWGWNGGEWVWSGGHYEADPSYKVYYDDDSYDVDEEFGDEGY